MSDGIAGLLAGLIACLACAIGCMVLARLDRAGMR